MHMTKLNNGMGLPSLISENRKFKEENSRMLKLDSEFTQKQELKMIQMERNSMAGAVNLTNG